MADITINATFDGATDVPDESGLVSWSSSSIIDRYSAFIDDPTDTLIWNGTFTGSDWRVRLLNIGDEAGTSMATITDANAFMRTFDEAWNVGNNDFPDW